jgi:hypothetical protein
VSALQVSFHCGSAPDGAVHRGVHLAPALLTGLQDTEALEAVIELGLAPDGESPPSRSERSRPGHLAWRSSRPSHGRSRRLPAQTHPCRRAGEGRRDRRQSCAEGDRPSGNQQNPRRASGRLLDEDRWGTGSPRKRCGGKGWCAIPPVVCSRHGAHHPPRPGDRRRRPSGPRARPRPAARRRPGDRHPGGDAEAAHAGRADDGEGRCAGGGSPPGATSTRA